jgi:hypothetical protein
MYTSAYRQLQKLHNTYLTKIYEDKRPMRISRWDTAARAPGGIVCTLAVHRKKIDKNVEKLKKLSHFPGGGRGGGVLLNTLRLL